jgi:DNA-binding GntR family transcriptional regulator
MVTEKYATLATELEKDILTGKYGWEGGLPTTSDLAQTCNMSINTIKNALALLEGKGLIEKRGAGFYVNRTPTIMTQYVSPIYSRPRGGYYQTLGTVKRAPLPAYIVEKLQISPCSAIFRMQVSGELAEGNERPTQVSYRYHLMDISNENMQHMQDDPNYDPLRNVPTELRSHDEITPRLATESERDLLNLPDPTAIQHIFEAIYKGDTLLMAQEIILHPRETLIFDFPFTNRPS